MDRTDITLTLLNTGARTSVYGQRHVLAALRLGKEPDTHFIGCCVGLGPVWVSPKILARTEFESQTPNPQRFAKLIRY